MIEIWKPIREWENLYEVSNFGRVRSLDRTIHVRNPAGYISARSYKGRILAASISGDGYFSVSFTAPGRKREYKHVHDLVCRAFHGEPAPGLEVRHLDGIKENCWADNLAWGTRSENSLDRNTHGTMPRYPGEEAASAKLTWQAVRYIRASKKSARALGREFGVCHKTICDALQLRSWK